MHENVRMNQKWFDIGLFMVKNGLILKNHSNNSPTSLEQKKTSKENDFNLVIPKKMNTIKNLYQTFDRYFPFDTIQLL